MVPPDVHVRRPAGTAATAEREGWHHRAADARQGTADGGAMRKVGTAVLAHRARARARRGDNPLRLANGNEASVVRGGV
jgi:hypothetical protein